MRHTLSLADIESTLADSDPAETTYGELIALAESLRYSDPERVAWVVAETLQYPDR